ncbi:MAG: class I SAM-dependent methyltransferase [Ferruginibacter sp.]
MYSRTQLFKKYIRFFLKAANSKGHGVHSPFVFDFIKNVLNDKTNYPEYALIERRRKQLLADKRVVEIQDFGAGSLVTPTDKRTVSKIARFSLKSKKYAHLLFRMVRYYQPQNVVELGTSLGVSTAYLAAATKNSVYSIEGAPTIAKIASETITQIGLTNVHLSTGNFDEQLPFLLEKTDKIGFAFVDGNHRKVPTISYFQQLMQQADNETILVFDDIHWSVQMEEAWEFIKADDSVTLSIDLFFIGIILFRNEFKVKQHFNIRF